MLKEKMNINEEFNEKKSELLNKPVKVKLTGKQLFVLAFLIAVFLIVLGGILFFIINEVKGAEAKTEIMGNKLIIKQNKIENFAVNNTVNEIDHINNDTYKIYSCNQTCTQIDPTCVPKDNKLCAQNCVNVCNETSLELQATLNLTSRPLGLDSWFKKYSLFKKTNDGLTFAYDELFFGVKLVDDLVYKDGTKICFGKQNAYTRLRQCDDYDYNNEKCDDDWIKTNMMTDKDGCFFPEHFSAYTIEISDAWHLNESRDILENVYNLIRYKDDNFTNFITQNQYLRVNFERVLTKYNEIRFFTILNTTSDDAMIEVYRKDNDTLINRVQLTNNTYSHVYLNDLNSIQEDVFDLKIINASVMFDYVTDPFADNGSLVQTLWSCGTLNTSNALYNVNQSITTTSTCFNVMAQNITVNLNGFEITGDCQAADYGVRGFHYYNVTTTNGTFRKWGTGVYYINTTNSLIDNIKVNDSECSTLSGTRAGIQLQSVNYSLVIRSNMSYIRGTGIEATAVGIKLFESNHNTIKDFFVGTTSGTSASWDVFLTGTLASSSNNSLINASYSTSKENVFGSLERRWYYNVFVNSTNQTAVQNANVTIYNVSGQVQNSQLTNSSGNTNVFEIIDYINNGTAKFYYSNYLISVNHSAFLANQTKTTNITTSQNVLNDHFMLLSDIVAPTISNIQRNQSYAFQNQYINFSANFTDNVKLDTIWFSDNFDFNTSYILNNTIFVASSITVYQSRLIGSTFLGGDNVLTQICTQNYYSNPSFKFPLTIRVYNATVGNIPTGSNLSYDIIPNTSIPININNYSCVNLSTPLYLKNNQKYAYTVYCPQCNITFPLRAYYSTTNTFPSGNMLFSTSNGSSWSSYPNYDAGLTLYFSNLSYKNTTFSNINVSSSSKSVIKQLNNSMTAPFKYYWCANDTSGFSSCSNTQEIFVYTTSLTDTIAPVGNISYPSNNSIVNGNVTLDGYATDNTAIYYSYFQFTNTTTWSNITECNNIYSPYDCVWNTASFSNDSGGYRIRIVPCDTNNNCNFSTTPKSYRIDRNIPTGIKTLIYPFNQSSVRVGQNITIKLNVTDGASSAGINISKIDIHELNGTTGNISMKFESGSLLTGQRSIWNYTIALLGSPTPNLYTYVFDNVTGNNNLWFDTTSVIIDLENPTMNFSDYGYNPNPAYVGDNITFQVNAVDNFNLSYYIFSTNITGTWINSSNISFPTSEETFSTMFNTTYASGAGTFGWMFTAYDDAGNSVDSTILNFTVLSESFTLNVTNIIPVNEANITGNNVNFSYNYTGGIADNCSLYINGILNQTQSSPTQNITNSFFQNLSYGSYNWNVGCFKDTEFISEEFNLNIISPRLGIAVLFPTTTQVNYTRNLFYNISINVSCFDSDCGEINVSLDPTLPSCYQETVNNLTAGDGTCTLNYTGEYGKAGAGCGADPVNWKDGDWSTFNNVNTGCSFYSNYSIPSGLESATLQTKYNVTGGAANYMTISCYNYSSGGTASISPTLVATNLTTINYTIPSGCLNGSKLLITHYGTSVDTNPQFYDEAINWYFVLEKGLISTTIGATPFYTNESNPRNISLNVNQSQEVIFWVNATGAGGHSYAFFAYANKTQDMSVSNITDLWTTTILAAPTFSSKIDLLFSNVSASSTYKTIFDESEDFNTYINWTNETNSPITSSQGYCNVTLYNALKETESIDQFFNLCSGGSCDYNTIYTEQFNNPEIADSFQKIVHFDVCHNNLALGNIQVSVNCSSGSYQETITQSQIPLCSAGNYSAHINTTTCASQQFVNVSIINNNNFARRKTVSLLNLDTEYTKHTLSFTGNADIFYNSSLQLWQLNHTHEYYKHGSKTITANCSHLTQSGYDNSTLELITIVNAPSTIDIEQLFTNNNEYNLTNNINISWSEGTWNWSIAISDDDLQFINYTFRNSSGALIQTNITTSPIFLQTPNGTFFTAQNSYNLSVYANDTFGNSTTKSILFNILSPISLNITYPQNTTYNTIISLINYTVSGSSQSCWFFNESVNTTITCGNNITGQNFADGSHSIILYSNDSNNIVYSSSRTFFVDTIFPQINITYPQNTSYNTQVTRLNYTLSDSNLQSCWWTNNSGSTNYSITCGNNITTSSIEGSNSWIVYVNDSVNNINSSSVAFYVDTLIPNLTIVSPINQTYTTTNILINLTNTSDSQAVWWYNGTANITYTQPVYFNFSQGSNTFYAYTNDSLNNLNTSIVNFFIDSISPAITVYSPLNQTYSTNQILINFTSSDVNGISSKWYYNGTANRTYTSEETIILQNGSYSFIFYSNDTNNNLNYSSKDFSINLVNASINIVYPTNITYFDNITYFNITFFSNNTPTNCKYSLNGAANVTFTCENNVTGLNLGDGSHSILAYINNSITDWTYSSVYFSINTTDVLYPIFSNIVVYPDNGTEYSGTIFQFNSTLLNTNGTVGIAFNGVNYTTSNLTFNVYNFTILNLGTSIFPYYWWAYGNGTSKLFNSTQVFYYTTNIVAAPSTGGGGGGGGVIISTLEISSLYNFNISNNTQILKSINLSYNSEFYRESLNEISVYPIDINNKSMDIEKISLTPASETEIFNIQSVKRESKGKYKVSVYIFNTNKSKSISNLSLTVFAKKDNIEANDKLNVILKAPEFKKEIEKLEENIINKFFNLVIELKWYLIIMSILILFIIVAFALSRRQG